MTTATKKRPGSISHPATSLRVLAELEPLLDGAPLIADVGCGRGHFCALLVDELESRGDADPNARVLPVDSLPQYYELDEPACLAAQENGHIPLADGSVDAAVSIEVIEHVEDQFDFVAEMARVVKPGGLVIVTTPNVHHVASRLRSLVWGFPQLYGPLPLSKDDPRFLGGHINPIHPYFLCYVAHRAGLHVESVVVDRRKTSAAIVATLLAPFAWLGQRFHRARLRRRHPQILEENRRWLDLMSSWDLATGRTAILVARRPQTDKLRAANT